MLAAALAELPNALSTSADVETNIVVFETSDAAWVVGELEKHGVLVGAVAARGARGHAPGRGTGRDRPRRRGVRAGAVVAAEVVGIYVSDEARRLPVPVDRAHAVAGRGLEGDRYFAGKGSFSHWRGTGRALTVVEAEALEDAGSRRRAPERGHAWGRSERPGGRALRIGEVELWARRLCEPCSHLEKLTERRDGLMRSLAGRGGIRVDVPTDGEIAVGDALVEIQDS